MLFLVFGGPAKLSMIVGPVWVLPAEAKTLQLSSYIFQTKNVPCPSKTLHAQKVLGEFHGASRNHTWNARILCAIHGVGHYPENFWGKLISVSLHVIFVMSPGHCTK